MKVKQLLLISLVCLYGASLTGAEHTPTTAKSQDQTAGAGSAAQHNASASLDEGDSKQNSSEMIALLAELNVPYDTEHMQGYCYYFAQSLENACKAGQTAKVAKLVSALKKENASILKNLLDLAKEYFPDLFKLLVQAIPNIDFNEIIQNLSRIHSEGLCYLLKERYVSMQAFTTIVQKTCSKGEWDGVTEILDDFYEYGHADLCAEALAGLHPYASPLVIAAVLMSRGNLVQELLKAHPDVDLTLIADDEFEHGSGKTALQIAQEDGNEDIVKLLLEHKKNRSANDATQQFETKKQAAEHNASASPDKGDSKRNASEIAAFLVELNLPSTFIEDMSSQNRSHISALLQDACEEGKTETVSKLLSRVNPSDLENLLDVAKSNFPDLFKLLVHAIPTIDFNQIIQPLAAIHSEGLCYLLKERYVSMQAFTTIAQQTCSKGYCGVVARILNNFDRDGHTDLCVEILPALRTYAPRLVIAAAMMDWSDLVPVLLKAYPDVDLTLTADDESEQGFGKTALQIAQEDGNEDIVKLLLEHQKNRSANDATQQFETKKQAAEHNASASPDKGDSKRNAAQAQEDNALKKEKLRKLVEKAQKAGDVAMLKLYRQKAQQNGWDDIVDSIAQYGVEKVPLTAAQQNTQEHNLRLAFLRNLSWNYLDNDSRPHCLALAIKHNDLDYVRTITTDYFDTIDFAYKDGKGKTLIEYAQSLQRIEAEALLQQAHKKQMQSLASAALPAMPTAGDKGDNKAVDRQAHIASVSSDAVTHKDEQSGAGAPLVATGDAPGNVEGAAQPVNTIKIMGLPGAIQLHDNNALKELLARGADPERIGFTGLSMLEFARVCNNNDAEGILKEAIEQKKQREKKKLEIKKAANKRKAGKERARAEKRAQERQQKAQMREEQEKEAQKKHQAQVALQEQQRRAQEDAAAKKAAQKAEEERAYATWIEQERNRVEEETKRQQAQARAKQEKLRLEQEAQQRAEQAAAQEKLRLEREEVERQEKLRREQEEKERQEKARKRALERTARGLVETAVVQATQEIVHDNRAQQERRQQAALASQPQAAGQPWQVDNQASADLMSRVRSMVNQKDQEERERQAKITSSQQQAVQHTQQQHKLSPALASKTNAREELLLNKCDSLEDAIATAIELYKVHKGNPSAQQIKITTNQVMREWVYEAASRGNMQEVLHCLKNTEPTISLDAESGLSGYTTPLLEAVKAGKIDKDGKLYVVEELLKARANPYVSVKKPIQFPTGESADETNFLNAALYCLYTRYNAKPLELAQSLYMANPTDMLSYHSKGWELVHQSVLRAEQTKQDKADSKRN